MNRPSHSSDIPQITSGGDDFGEPFADDVNELAAYDEQLREGRASYSTIQVGNQSTHMKASPELLACLNLIERIWPRSAPSMTASALPSRIGRFEIERVLGQGGFGVVYLAQDPVLHRSVALKVPRLHSLVDQKLRERFYREAHAAAGLDHPNIVPIYEAGEEGPVCYIASAYCAGPNLAQWIKQQASPVQPRVATLLIAKLADAAHYSHAHGVFHRDVKPSNVMLVPYESRELPHSNDEIAFIPRLTDFGLAKLLDGSADETAASATLGTPAYMAPEQAGGSPAQIGPHTDVYALGTVLYELLTNRPVFQGSSVADLLDQVRNSDPVSPRRLRREIPRDLEIICLKCLEKQPGRRYATARELSDDLHRFLRGEPVRARRPGAVDVMFHWMRRRPAMAFAGAVSVLAVVTLLLGGWYYNHHLARALQVAQQLQTESVDRERALQLQLYAADLRTAWKAWEAGDGNEALQHLIRHKSVSGEADLRGFEWHFLMATCEPGIHSLRGHLAEILTVDVSSDDRFIASGDRGGTVRIWYLATGKEFKTLQYGTQEVTSVRFAPDARTLATGGQDRTIRLWNVDNWSEKASLQGHDLTVTSLAWSPDGTQLASGGRDGRIKIWDTQSCREAQSLPDQTDVVRCVTWSPDGKLVAAAVREDGLHLWSTNNWQRHKSLTGGRTGGTLTLAFSSDSTRLASGGYGGSLLLHDIASARLLADVDLPGAVWSLGFSPSSGLLLAGGSNGLMHLLETHTAEGELAEFQTIQTGEGDIRGVLFARAGQTLITALEQDRVLQLRNVDELARRRPHRFTPACLDIARNTNRGVLLEKNGRLNLTSLSPSEPVGSRLPQLGVIRDAAFFFDGNLVAAIGDKSGVQVVDTATKELQYRLEATEKILAVTVSADDKRIAGSDESGAVWLWDIKTRAVLHRLEGHHKSTVRMAFSGDGRLLATASSNEQQVLLWDVATGQRTAELHTAQDVMALAFSPDGKTLAVAGFNNLAMLWDVASGRQVGALRGHVGALRAIAYSPDGQTLVTAGDDGTARLWHVATRQELCILTRRSLPLRWVRFLSPHRLVVGTAPYGSPTQNSSDVLVFDTAKPSQIGEQPASDHPRISLDGPK